MAHEDRQVFLGPCIPFTIFLGGDSASERSETPSLDLTPFLAPEDLMSLLLLSDSAAESVTLSDGMAGGCFNNDDDVRFEGLGEVFKRFAVQRTRRWSFSLEESESEKSQAFMAFSTVSFGRHCWLHFQARATRSCQASSLAGLRGIPARDQSVVVDDATVDLEDLFIL